MSRLQAHANQKFEVQLLQMEDEVTPARDQQRASANAALHMSIMFNIYTTNPKIEYGIDESSSTRMKCAHNKTITQRKKNTCQHGSNPSRSLDSPVVGGGLQPPTACGPENGKPTTHPDIGQSNQTPITGWNELPRPAWNC